MGQNYCSSETHATVFLKKFVARFAFKANARAPAKVKRLLFKDVGYISDLRANAVNIFAREDRRVFMFALTFNVSVVVIAQVARIWCSWPLRKATSWMSRVPLRQNGSAHVSPWVFTLGFCRNSRSSSLASAITDPASELTQPLSCPPAPVCSARRPPCSRGVLEAPP